MKQARFFCVSSRRRLGLFFSVFSRLVGKNPLREGGIVMRAVRTGWAVVVLCTALCAHFQVILPSDEIVSEGGKKTVELRVVFTHPMEQGPVMEMGEPKQFGVLVGGKKQDLKSSLVPITLMGKRAYKCSYRIKAPGDYIFYIEPSPYWEPAEEKMIIHYTKVVVDAFGAEEGWEAMVGFPVEIEPLVRPYGLWTGNVFRGIVKKDGKPVPFAEVEVEYYNEGEKVRIPSDPFVTQVIKADGNGVFSYAIPRAGWWGFAGLLEGDRKMKNPDGKLVDVELGAVIWVKATDMSEK